MTWAGLVPGDDAGSTPIKPGSWAVSFSLLSGRFAGALGDLPFPPAGSHQSFRPEVSKPVCLELHICLYPFHPDSSEVGGWSCWRTLPTHFSPVSELRKHTSIVFIVKFAGAHGLDRGRGFGVRKLGRGICTEPQSQRPLPGPHPPAGMALWVWLHHLPLPFCAQAAS